MYKKLNTDTYYILDNETVETLIYEFILVLNSGLIRDRIYSGKKLGSNLNILPNVFFVLAQ